MSAMSNLKSYLLAPLVDDLDASQQFRLLRAVFLLTFLSVVVTHLLFPEPQLPMYLGLHAIVIALSYTVAIALLGALLYALHQFFGFKLLLVWQVWLMSFAGFVFGSTFSPLDHPVESFLNLEDQHGIAMHFFRLLPLWLLLTYLFVQAYLTQSLRAEIDRLSDSNAIPDDVEQNRAAANVVIEVGRSVLQIDANAIRRVTVEDHYCYVHFKREGTFEKQAFAAPLKDIAALLPDAFLQVHRSHLINLNHVVRFEKRARAYDVVLDDSSEIPISRHRLGLVLPRLQEWNASGE